VQFAVADASTLSFWRIDSLDDSNIAEVLAVLNDLSRYQLSSVPPPSWELPLSWEIFGPSLETFHSRWFELDSAGLADCVVVTVQGFPQTGKTDLSRLAPQFLNLSSVRIDLKQMLLAADGDWEKIDQSVQDGIKGCLSEKGLAVVLDGTDELQASEGDHSRAVKSKLLAHFERFPDQTACETPPILQASAGFPDFGSQRSLEGSLWAHK
jgi:hypothetical protein